MSNEKDDKTMKPTPVDESVSIVERDQSGNVTAEYREESNTIIRVHHAINSPEPLRVQPQTQLASYLQQLVNVFLPAGYPNSVTEDYIEYQIYDSLQAFSSSIAGLLSSRAVLQAVGFEDSNASPTAAILLSILQESIGRLATIMFAHKLGSSLEPECKQFRFAADIFNDSALILDCMSPILPKTFRIMLLCTAGTLRALCGVAGGGSKAQLSVHFAKWGNVAELNAKDSSQETVISLMGMLAGSFVISSITSKMASWVTILFLIAIHLWTNYRAVKAVTMVTLNRQRANILMSNFLEAGVVLSPKEVAKKERIFERDGVLRWCNGQVIGWGLIGTKMSTIVASLASTGGAGDKAGFKDIAKACQNEQYLLWVKQESKFKVPDICICLENGCLPASQLKAWMHGLVSARKLSETEQQQPEVQGKYVDALHVLVTAKQQVDGVFEAFLERLTQRGWDVQDPQLETTSGFRYERAML